MNVLRNVRSFVCNYFEEKKKPPKEAKQVGLFEVYFEKLLVLLLWEDTETTLQFLLVSNFIFFIYFIYKPHFYGLISLLSLVIFIYDWVKRSDLYNQYTGNYSNFLSKVRNIFHKTFNDLCILRKETPILYYPSMILFFWTLYWISKFVELHKSLYVLVLFLFILKQVSLSIPESVLTKIETVFNALAVPSCTLAEYELIPFIEGKDLSRKDADLESLLTDRTADSVSNSLISGIPSMPSFLEVVESHEEIQEEDLIPLVRKPGVSSTPGELSSDSDSEPKDIRFDSDHFNTSSSEDDPYSKDLKFTKMEQPTNNQGVSMFRSVMNTVGGHIAANMFQSAVYSRLPEMERRNSNETDSDFELVDAEELDYELRKNN